MSAHFKENNFDLNLRQILTEVNANSGIALLNLKISTVSFEVWICDLPEPVLTEL